MSVGVRTAPTLRPFPMDRVRIADDSVFARARDRMLHLARVYPVDRLLAVFRANAGLDTRGAAAPGNWEDFGHPNEQPWGEQDYPGRENAQTANLLRGHYAGHFLSMLSLAYAGEQDEALRAKVDGFVAGLGEVQHALAASGRYSHPGFLAAYGEWQFSRLEDFAPYGEIWAPYYTTHKIMAGLLDAYELAGSIQARDIAVAMGHWVAHRLTRLDHDRIQRMWSLYIAGEYGGMNETMARLSVIADEPLFLRVARLFDQHDLLDAGAERRDVLTDMHANQHLPQLIGYLHEHELTGDGRYLDAVLGLWDQIVPGRVYAHGGTGESELWGAPGAVAGDIGHRNAETCATYNLLKLARQLFARTRDPRFMAYYERGVLNHILASRRSVDSDTSPEVAYMFPVHPGALAEFNNIGTCCGGTGLENHVKYQDTVFFAAADDAAEVWINLFVPSTLDWREQNVTVRLSTALPFGGSAEVRIDDRGGFVDGTPLVLRVRIPEWGVGDMALRVDGAPIEAIVENGYLVVRRPWRSGETLHIDAPVALRAHPTPDDATLQSVEFGPSVLVARSDATTTLDLPLAQRRRLDGSLCADDAEDAAAVGAALRADGGVRIGGVRFEPVWTGKEERYHMYVRSAGTTVGFAGAETAVPVRFRSDGRSLLDDVWAAPAPSTRAAFLDRVGQAASAARRDGLLTNDELTAVLRAAAAADVDGAGVRLEGKVEVASRAAEPEPAVAWVEQLDGGASRTVWSVPDSLTEAPTLPAVAIATETAPAPSGWFTTVPTIRVDAEDLTGVGGLRVEVAVDDDGWTPYRGPFALPGDGAHRVRARATDRDGVTGHATREFSVDITAPVTHATVRRLGASVEITLSAADEISGVERIQWEGPGTFWATFQEAFVRALSDREQVIEFAATDRAGNEGARQRLVLPALDGAHAESENTTWT